MAEFTTSVTRVRPGEIVLRGYRAEDLIRHAGASEVMFLLLAGRPPVATERRVFEAVLTCCADHGLVNTAAVAGRYIMSGSASLPAAMAAGILAFGASTGTAHLTAEMLAELALGDPAGVSDAQIRDHVAALRSRGAMIPGLGHPLHREVDPRESTLRDVAAEAGFDSPHAPLLDRVRAIAGEILGRRLVLNVDGLFGAYLLDMGFTSDAIFAVNIIGALPGIAAHAIEERETGRRLRVPPAADVADDGVPSGLRWPEGGR